MNEIENSYPVKEAQGSKKTANTFKRERISVLNIGQLLFLAFLFVMLLFQSINIYTNNPINSDIKDMAEKNGNIADTGEKINFHPPTYDFSENNSAANLNLDTADGGIIFVLGEYEGKLTVLSPDKTIAYEVFDVYINTLPAYDKELLYNGINIRSREELYSLLEDYNS